jgi:hypothetical protein
MINSINSVLYFIPPAHHLSRIEFLSFFMGCPNFRAACQLISLWLAGQAGFLWQGVSN